MLLTIIGIPDRHLQEEVIRRRSIYIFLLQCCSNCPMQRLHRRHIGRGQKDYKLITANPAYSSILAGRKLQAAGSLDQQRIPSLMAKAVIDDFQTININNNYAQALGPRAGDILPYKLFKIISVIYPCQGVMIAHIPQFLL